MDQVAICNLALGWLGSTLIVSIDDATTEAELCKANWGPVRDAVLEAKPWTFAVKREALAADATPPAYGWAVRYQLPSTALRVLEADDGSGYADFEWVVEGRFILSSQGAPLSIRYLQRVEDPTLWSPGFAMAVAHRLAFVLATPLTENRALQADLWNLYQKQLLEAGRLDGMQGRSERQRPSTLAQRRF